MVASVGGYGGSKRPKLFAEETKLLEHADADVAACGSWPHHMALRGVWLEGNPSIPRQTCQTGQDRHASRARDAVCMSGAVTFGA